ncbi:MAG TPA: amidase [Anaeromyxobacteraceae bacterium]|nr:amidase [Anaeromyxobacteraceae bacterium]
MPPTRFWLLLAASLLLAPPAILAGGADAPPAEPPTAPASRPAAGAAAPAQGLELEEATVAELQAGMSAGRFTARQLAEAYLARIAALDPALRSVAEVNPDALAVADALDAERREKGPRGPLHGIPVLVKDNVATGDRMETTAGSLALLGARPPRDAFLVGRLRTAGAVILGKTNLSEWANIRSSHSSSGWSARGGQTRNPYALDRNPCGSSSGTGAAVAANLAAVGVGTETDGSIVCPSSANGLVGVKPTVGLVSRSGIVPISASQDTAGPMARTVADAAALLSAMAGVDPADPATAAARGRAPADYAASLDADALRGARIGVARKKLFGSSEGVDRLMEEAIAEMRRRGAVVVDPADIPHLGEYDEAELEVLLHELKDGLARYLGEWAPGAPVRTLADVIEFNRRHREREMPYFGQDLFEKAAGKGTLADRAYRRALARSRRLAGPEGLVAVMDRHRLDAVVAPTGGPAWVTDLVNGDHFVVGSSTPAAVAGTPAVTVPAGQVFGLPVGITFMGRAFGEARLLGLAHAFEQATRHRRPPSLAPQAELGTR